MIPKILLQKAEELEAKTKEKYPELAPLAKQCFLNTMETTVTQLEDGSYFVITGDIPAMWLRDSAAQLKPYIKYAGEDPDLQAILKSVIEKHVFYVNLDPYSNAFNGKVLEKGYSEDDHSNFTSGWIWERKYEVDSLCASLYLSHEYYQVTGDKSIFTEEFRLMIQTIVDVFTTEQRLGPQRHPAHAGQGPSCQLHRHDLVRLPPLRRLLQVWLPHPRQHDGRGGPGLRRRAAGGRL